MLYPVSIAERCAQSELIVEGKVFDKTSVKGTDGGMIYTAYKIRPFKVFKGNTTEDIVFIAEGGVVGNEAVTVSPGISLEIPTSGIFFLRRKKFENLPASLKQTNHYEVYAGVQGIITFLENQAKDPFTAYNTIDKIEQIIKGIVKQDVIILHQEVDKNTPSKDKSEKALAASITSISPTTITAGRDEVLTINGNGFGTSYTGTANVQFKSADDGGSSWVSILASHIVSWTNTQIQVKVRTSAGTGQVRVTAVDGTQATSAETLTISYNLLNITASGNVQYKTWLQNQDGSGGITFTLNTSFNSNAAAVNAFKRALQTWRCNTYVNLKISESTTSVSSESGSDGVNVVAFNDANLPSGVLGVTYNYWSSCATGNWYVTALDMIFRTSAGSAGWNFGPQATTGGKFDFESVCLHELGHAHQLGHVIDNSIIMHYSVSPNSDKRTLSATSDIAGGNEVVTYSTSSKSCGPNIMTALNSSNCQVGLPPVANFSANPVSGCASLNVSFTDLSTNTPTSWAWDVDNNGSTDYTTQNINHTFSNAGTYSVKLTATNGNGTNSVTKTNYITVNALPSARSGGLKKPCQGQQITLGGTPAATGGTPPYTYSWNPTTGLSNAASANPTLVCNFTETRLYVLTVTDGSGCSSTARDTIIPSPITTVNAGADRTVCYGALVALGGSPTALNGTAPYTYSWSPATGLSNPTSANPSLTAIQERTFLLTVTDANNCVYIDSVKISLYPRPVASAGADKSVCIGNSVTIGGSPAVTGGTPPHTYAWSPITGLSSSSIANPIATPTQTTKYTLTITDANNCIIRDTVQVTVHSLPQPIITASGSLSICDGDTITLSTGEFSTYAWSNGINARSIKVSTGGQYTVTVTDANNCTATSSAVTITVLPKPSPTITAIKPLAFCVGDSTVLDAGAGYNTYLWSNGASTRTITAKQTGAYFVTVTNNQGCKGSSQPVEVVSKPYPDKVITGPNSLCENSTATYSVTPSDMTSNTWQVINGDIEDGQGTNSIKVKWKQQSGSISIIRDRLGCVSIGSYPITISSTLKPVISITEGLPCTGDTLTLSAPEGYTSYSWANGAKTRSIKVTTNGAFTVTVSDANDCKGTSDEFSVQFTAKPEKPIVTRVGDTLYSTPAFFHQWYRNGDVIPGANDSRFTLKQSGDYMVLVKDPVSCSNVSQIYSVGILGIDESNIQSFLSIIPNPAHNTIHIQHPFGDNVRIQILNTLGERVLPPLESTTDIDITNLHDGAYFVIVEHSNVRYSLVFIKER